jgi:1,4-dihydroxy-2-naphthoate octaprenyltransferase
VRPGAPDRPAPQAPPRRSLRSAWLVAARPQTLAASVTPVLLGTALAASDGAARGALALAAVATALLLQLGTNFANDLFDFEKGADTEERLGPTRAVAGGLLSPAQMRVGIALAFGGAALTGSFLAAAGGWPFWLLGSLSIAAGLAYTAGPWPLAYHGLGDLTVFAFFGLVAAAGSYAVQAQTLPPRALVVALPSAFLVTAILVVNNLRDLDTDARAGKRTIAVRWGRSGTQAYFAALLLAAFAGVIGLVVAGVVGVLALLPLLTLPAALRALRVVLTRREGPALNGALVQIARVHAAFTLLLAFGVLP